MSFKGGLVRASCAAILLAGVALVPLRGASAAAFGSLSSLIGSSGKLKAVFSLPGDKETASVAGAAGNPGVYPLAAGDTAVTGNLSLIVLKPFSAKVNGRIGTYRMGTWPYEKGTPRSASYAPPKGFVEVTRETFGTHVSEHFTVGEFVTKDQRDVWPKYVALDRRLIDKLELTIAELNLMGYPVKDFAVMSGFRTPQYNERGVGTGGRSAVSRHQYGDAADVYPDDNGDGRLDDLNKDGRVDMKDARILASAAEAVEKKNPELLGGVGLYNSTSAHGPFVHIDARGTRARWGG
ncbi:MAG TPA: hypothetical protein VFF17_01280 [Thermoanaerobaculia bacterium]|nr:hypothetical protein [Thermoanaerobaculia bacterium]